MRTSWEVLWMTDPYLQRIDADMDTWLVLERLFCQCDGLCQCGWDDQDEDS